MDRPCAQDPADQISALESKRDQLRREIAELKRIAERHRRRALELEHRVDDLHATKRQLERALSPRP